MSVDRFPQESLTAPARACFAVIPDDTAELIEVPKALYIGTGGSVRLRAVDSDTDVDFVNLASGSILDVRALYVRVEGTTATDIVGLA